MSQFFKFFIRISAFLNKELTEIFRQPKLILTLVLGPFLIMFLFGMANPEHGRTLRTIFVTRDPDTYRQEIDSFATSFRSIIVEYSIETSAEEALKKLAGNKTDMVILIPDGSAQAIENNQRAEFTIYHNEIDPFQVAYIKSVGGAYVDEFNRKFLESTVEQGQTDSGSVQDNLEAAILKTQALQQVIPADDLSGTGAQVADLEKDLMDLNTQLSTFQNTGTKVLVTPFSAKVHGLADIDLSVIMFFAPAVIALLLQHFSITFASLSIVREAHSGIMELFKVSPITAFETLLGKYISYILLEIILAGVITVLAIWLLQIPISGHWLDYVLIVLVLLFTSLGVGFFISLISENDTQAVQYSMLLLLASIFFSGFFLDLRLMKEPITFLAWSLPATYGIRMLQDVMLRGASAPMILLLALLFMGIILFMIDWLLLRRKMQS
jgi:ABC-2 type transport system permease protein